MKSFKLPTIYEDISKQSYKSFKIFLIFLIASYSAYMASTCIFNKQFVYFVLQYESFSHIIHLQGFQLLLYSKAKEVRFELLSRVLFEDDDETEMKLQHLKEALVQMFEVARETNKCFSLSLLLTFCCLYGLIVNNLQWIGISFLGVPYAYAQGR